MANLTPVNSFDDVIQLETNTIALGGVGGNERPSPSLIK